MPKHIRYCVTPKIEKPRLNCKLWLQDGRYVCPDCGFESHNTRQIISHYWKLHTEAGQNHKPEPASNINGKHKSWNKGLTKDTDIRVANNSIASGKALKGRKGTTPSELNRRNTSIRMSLRNPGGKSKWYEVAGQKVQGTWERDIALKLEELGIRWYKAKVNKDVWSYELDGKTRSYTPDIHLIDLDIYLEIKGYWWGNDRAKMAAVMAQHPNKKLLIIEHAEYKKILGGELVW
jgi:hypothetical protein